MGFEDAERVVKMFQPVFDSEDLQNVPNHNAVAKILVNGMQSQAFSLWMIPPMGHPNQQLADALRKLSAAKYGRPRAQVEKTIHERLNSVQIAQEKDKQQRLEAMRASSTPGFGSKQTSTHVSSEPDKRDFLDSWLQKRKSNDVRESSGGLTLKSKQNTQKPSENSTQVNRDKTAVSGAGDSIFKPINGQVEPVSVNNVSDKNKSARSIDGVLANKQPVKTGQINRGNFDSDENEISISLR